MRDRIALLGATVSWRWIDRDREVGDRQTLVFGQRYQDHIGIGRIEQGFVLDHHRRSQLVRSVGSASARSAMTIWPPENPANELCVLDPGRPPCIVEHSRLGRARDILTDGAALSAYPLPPQARSRFDRDLP